MADERMAALIDEAAEPVRLGTGFGFVEGPVWNPREQCLYFSDIKADTRRRWSERDGNTVARHPNNMGNGMTYDADLALITCEHATSQVTREADGRVQVIASHYRGKELNSPNDVVVSRSGAIYFSDPCLRPHPGGHRDSPGPGAGLPGRVPDHAGWRTRAAGR